jgi:hypothetical protein
MSSMGNFSVWLCLACIFLSSAARAENVLDPYAKISQVHSVFYNEQTDTFLLDVVVNRVYQWNEPSRRAGEAGVIAHSRAFLFGHPKRGLFELDHLDEIPQRPGLGPFETRFSNSPSTPESELETGQLGKLIHQGRSVQAEVNGHTLTYVDWDQAAFSNDVLKTAHSNLLANRLKIEGLYQVYEDNHQPSPRFQLVLVSIQNPKLKGRSSSPHQQQYWTYDIDAAAAQDLRRQPLVMIQPAGVDIQQEISKRIGRSVQPVAQVSASWLAELQIPNLTWRLPSPLDLVERDAILVLTQKIRLLWGQLERIELQTKSEPVVNRLTEASFNRADKSVDCELILLSKLRP